MSRLEVRVLPPHPFFNYGEIATIETYMKTKILFRHDYTTEDELAVAKSWLDVTDSRVGLSNTLVVGRYSVLPFYQELEKDLISQGSRLINSYEQHKYIADFEYYHDIKDLTPETFLILMRSTIMMGLS